MAGRQKNGEDISFLSHEDPVFFLEDKNNTNLFIRDLRERLMEIKTITKAYIRKLSLIMKGL